MGSSKKQTVGYWYVFDIHFGLCWAADAMLEMRGGDHTAWQGRVTSNGPITINAPNLWGGEDGGEGGIVATLHMMFGGEDQAPHAQLESEFGQASAYRGKVTAYLGRPAPSTPGSVWEFLASGPPAQGAKYGAYNPYPKPASFKLERIHAGWPKADPGDPDLAWYPAKAAIAVITGGVFTEDMAFPATSASIDGTYAGLVLDAGFDERDVLIIEKPPGLTYKAWSPWSSDSDPNAGGLPWSNTFEVTDAENVTTKYWGEQRFETADAAEQGVLGNQVQLGGSSSYKIWLHDTPVHDNRGGLSLRVYKNGLRAMNPAHMLYYSKVSPTMEGVPAALLDDANWRAEADQLFSEGFGLCTSWDPTSESVEQYQDRILAVIGGAMARSRRDGKWRLYLLRGNYDLNSLPILTDNDILEWKDQPSTLDDAVNQLQVKWFDPQNKEERITAPEHALAAIEAFGGVISQTLNFPEIPVESLALRVNSRELASRGTPLSRITLVCTRKAAAWDTGAYIRVQAPKRGIADMVCLVMDSDVGATASSAVKLVLAQDIFRLPDTTYVQPQEVIDTSPSLVPVAVLHQRIFEAPFVELAATLPHAELAALPAEGGFLQVMAQYPGAGINYTLVTALEDADFNEFGNSDWCPSALIVGASGFVDTEFTVVEASRLERVSVGTAALWGEEIVRVDALDVEVGTITLGRACADTTPQKHAAGERIWFYDEWAGTDGLEYALGETVHARALTRTSTARLALTEAPNMSLTLDQRHARPYPPALFRVNGEVQPGSVIGDVEATWVHRDRLLQADQLIESEAATIGPEPGTTYTLRAYLNNVLDDEQTGITGTSATWSPAGAGLGRVEVFAVRDGLESWQAQVREIALGNPLQSEDGSLITTEDGQPILME